jgi:uncharacterized protein
LSEVHLSQVVLKIAQRCNLDCTYCYVYNRGDESWRSRPAYISDRVTRQLGARIRKHCERHGLDAFTVELHGGEPLLLGRRRFQQLVDTLRRESAPARLHLILQTNGTLLDDGWLGLFARNGIRFGISLDGPPETADLRRVTRRRREGSTQTVLDNIRALRSLGPTFDELCGGYLCVIDPTTDGAAMVHWFADQGLSPLDLLLPDGNLANLPQEWSGVEPYRRFLIEAFDAWCTMIEGAPHIRLFDLMLTGLMGGHARLDALGGDLRRLCVVESDGSIGVSDTVRICGDTFAHDRLNIFDHELDLHARGYGIEELQQLCDQCERCPHLASCGGGYLPHRFDGTTFNNPSLYCDALYALSDRMIAFLKTQLPSRVWTHSLDETHALQIPAVHESS